MGQHILAIDQGTTSSRSIIFSPKRSIDAIAQQEFSQKYPKDGWVEHDPEEIWESVVVSLHLTSPPLVLPTSARQPWYGINTQVNPYTMQSCGKTDALHNTAVILAKTRRLFLI